MRKILWQAGGLENNMGARLTFMQSRYVEHLHV